MTDLDTRLRIAQSFALLPLGTAVNRGPHSQFPVMGGSKGSKGFPATSSVAIITVSPVMLTSNWVSY